MLVSPFNPPSVPELTGLQNPYQPQGARDGSPSRVLMPPWRQLRRAESTLALALLVCGSQSHASQEQGEGPGGSALLSQPGIGSSGPDLWVAFSGMLYT